MNAPPFSFQSLNPQLDSHHSIDERAKKKQYNDRYQDKRKHAIDILNDLKSVSNVR